VAASAALLPALSNGDVIVIVVLLAIPVAAIAFIAGARNRFDEIGKGGFGLELESDAPEAMRDSGAEAATDAVRADEVRQMLEGKAYRQRARGEEPLDVDAELERLLAEQRAAAPDLGDAGLRDEVRQLVVARNERRRRQGKEPLDVEAEVERQLRELENLGQ
jgi:hypothetical protein